MVGKQRNQNLLPGSKSDAGCPLLCVSVSWCPSGILIDFGTDLSGYREKQVSIYNSVSLTLWLSLSLPFVHVQTLRTISGVLLIGKKNVSQAFILEDRERG